MKKEKFKDHRDSHHCGDGQKRKEHHHGAKTFRRGRAVAFLEMMNVKRATLKQQLQTKELQSINPILVGELKALEMIINEFVQLFELYEMEGTETDSEKTDGEENVSTAKEDLENKQNKVD